jgi:hypothetical protein
MARWGFTLKPPPTRIASDRLVFSAVLAGPGNCYRYELRRVWNAELPLLVVCMLNPSNADHQVNDPTILALVHFAAMWGYGGILVINLFAYRASSPAEMMGADSPIGPDNHRYIEDAFVYAKANGGKLLAAWGNGGTFEGRDEWFCGRARMHGLQLICLGTTKGWHPKHPMARGVHRIPRNQQPVEWR